MYAAALGILLSLALTLFSADSAQAKEDLSQASMWLCFEPGGTPLYTDRFRESSGCESYTPKTQLNYYHYSPQLRLGSPYPPSVVDSQ